MASTISTRSAAMAAINALAERQHGMVSRGQLLAAGVSRGFIARCLSHGSMFRFHRGVYRVGPLLAPLGREMAACLACGESALLSHRTAASVLEIMKPARRGPVELIARDGQCRLRGLRVYRIRTLEADEHTVVRSVPITTAARTLLDLAGTLSVRDLERAAAEAEVRRLATLPQLRELQQRHPSVKGAHHLAAVLGGGPAFTRSEAEERFLALVRRANLPEPEVNVVVERHEVDFYWRRARMVVEVDGYRYHGSAVAFERDRRRDAFLTAAGYTVLRVTWRQIVVEPLPLMVSVGQSLAKAAAR